MIHSFYMQFVHYVVEVVPYLALGFFLSGLVQEFLPGRYVEKYLGRGGIKPLFYATFLGATLPICCIGSLPVAVSMHRKGAGLGPVLAFLVATPATSLSALIVSLALLGWTFTLYLFFAVIVMGMVIGLIGNYLHFASASSGTVACPYKKAFARDPVCGMQVDQCGGIKTEFRGRDYYFCSRHCLAAFEKGPEQYSEPTGENSELGRRVKSVFRYAFWEMPRDMGLEILIGLALAALVASVAPIGEFVGDYFAGGLAYPFSLVFGLIMYICSTASVPLVDAFLSQGMNKGAAMVLLMVGPVTSLGTILVLKKEFGARMLSLYLLVIGSVSLALGYVFSLVY